MNLVVSSPGKIHFLGEHTVVFGKPALLATIDKRLYIRIKNLELRIKNNKEEIKIEASENKSLIYQSIDVFKKAFSITNLPSMEITVSSQIPIGCGLGSSAALSASTIGALMKFVKNIWNPTKINELSYEVEKIAHGFPSGADNTTVVFGGLIWFRREFDFLKSIWALSIKSYQIPRFLLIDTGRPQESTKEMVESVARLYQKKKKIMEDLFSEQEKQTKKLLLALRDGDRSKLRKAIMEGERNLEKMGVVGHLAQKVIREIEKLGGCAKICGAGGKKEGSGMILVFHEDLSKIKKIGRKHNLPVCPVRLGEEGIRIEPFNHLTI